MEEARLSLMALSPALFFGSISAVLRGYFNGIKQISKTATSQVIEQISKCILIIGFVEIASKLTMNTTVFASVANFGTATSIMISLLYLLAIFFETKKILNSEAINCTYYNESNIKIIKNILKISIPIGFSAILGTLNKNIDSITIVRILTPILGEELAKLKYGIISSKVDILTMVPLSFNIAFSTVLIPEVSAAFARNDYENINKKVSFSLLITGIIAIPTTILMSVYSNQILHLLFPNSSGGGELLKISSFCIIFMAFNQTIVGVLHGIGKNKSVVFTNIVGVFIKLLFNIILLPVENIYEKGAIISNLISCFVIFSINLHVLRKNLRIKWDFRQFFVKK